MRLVAPPMATNPAVGLTGAQASELETWASDLRR
jgi:hypothetical protein